MHQHSCGTAPAREVFTFSHQVGLWGGDVEYRSSELLSRRPARVKPPACRAHTGHARLGPKTTGEKDQGTTLLPSAAFPWILPVFPRADWGGNCRKRGFPCLGKGVCADGHLPAGEGLLWGDSRSLGSARGKHSSWGPYRDSSSSSWHGMVNHGIPEWFGLKGP